MSRLFGILRSPVLKNSGSVARDYLAAERTMLAWLRAGLGLIAMGTALDRFSRFDLDTLLNVAKKPLHSSPTTSSANTKSCRDDREREHLMAMSVLTVGGGSIVYGVGRYFSTMSMLGKGLFAPSYLGAGAAGLVAASIAAASFVYSLGSHL